MNKMILFNLLLIGFCIVTAERNIRVCDEPEKNCGLIPPTVPDSFVLKSLEVDEINERFTWVEKYFDPSGQRAKLLTISNGKQTTYLFDYDIDQITTYERLHPGAPLDKDPNSQLICLTDDMRNSKSRMMMGYKDNEQNTKRSPMYDAYQALGFGGPHKYVQNESYTGLPFRGVLCDVFTGCIHDRYADSTFSNVFYWTKDILTDTGALIMPVRIESTGGYYEKTENPNVQWTDQKIISEIVFFDPNPSFQDSDFQAPPRMNCQSKDKSVKVPKLSEAFSTRFESIITVENFKGEIKVVTQDWYEELWYDKPRQLARQDFYPNIVEDLTLAEFFNVNSRVSAVYDFKTGLAYYTEKTYGRCVVSQIPDFTYFSKKSEDGKRMEMVSEMELFDFDNKNLGYKGKYTMRDIKCDAWSGNQEIIKENGTSQAYREVYFTTDGWHQETDKEESFSIPVHETKVFNTKNDGQDALEYMEINYYKFKMTPSPLSTFDISGCVEHSERRSFVIQFDVEFRQLINNHRNAFKDRFVEKIVQYGGLESLLRVQELDILFSEETATVHVYFTLLEKPKITGATTYPQQGVDLKAAILRIKGILEKGQFIVDLMVDQSAEKTNLVPVENTFREIDFKTSTVVDIDSFYSSQNENSPMHAEGETKKAKENTGKRYSPASVGGLAVGMLFVGVIIGAIIMMFYLRKVNIVETNDSSMEFSNRTL